MCRAHQSPKRYKEDKKELGKTSFGNKRRQFNATAKNEDGLKIPPQVRVSLVMDKEYFGARKPL